MKVVCLIDSLGSGGAQRQLVGLARLLKEHACQVKVLWYHESDFYQSCLDKYMIDYENAAPGSKISKLKFVASGIKKDAPDVVIAYLDGPTVITCLLRLLGFRYHLIVSERNTTQKLTMKSKLKFFLYRWADVVVSNSYTQKKYIEEHFPCLRPKNRVITNFTDVGYFFPKVKSFLSSFPVRILVVGRINKQKNVLRFLEAIKIVADQGIDIHVDWFGNAFCRNYEQECLNKKEEFGLENIVQFHTASKDVREIYWRSDVFCLPSLYEGFPNVICEAMACGLPILCSNVCDNSLIVEDNKNGYLFNPLSVEDIAAKIIRFIYLEEEQKDIMRQYSRQIAVKNFSEEKFITSYLELIDS